MIGSSGVDITGLAVQQACRHADAAVAATLVVLRQAYPDPERLATVLEELADQFDADRAALERQARQAEQTGYAYARAARQARIALLRAELRADQTESGS